MNDQIVESLFANRMMPLDRAAMPSLASIAQLRVGASTVDDLARRRAGMFDKESATIRVQRSGSTAIVPLTGLITSDSLLAWIFGGTNPDIFVNALEQEIRSTSVDRVVMLVDSPGGEVGLITETAARIRRLRASKPIIAIARTTMCSAAYWLAASASQVVATPSAHVGSVGVFMCHAEQSRMLDKAGITVTYITSDPRKVEGNPHEVLHDEARAHLKRSVDETHENFIADLAAGLSTSAANIRANFGGGRAFGAAEALRRGMVSKISTLEDLLAGFAVRGPGGAAARAFHSDDLQIRADVDAAAAAIAIVGAL